MPDYEKSNRKLLPLRHFADDKLYTGAYLSQLVQRNRLKAEKIGRNYFTCEKWFREYLDKHACDDKRAVHEKLEKQKAKNTFKFKSWVTAAIATAVFILLIFMNIFINKTADEQGQVAGVVEYNISTSTR
jgi:hypothetical protein